MQVLWIQLCKSLSLIKSVVGYTWGAETKTLNSDNNQATVRGHMQVTMTSITDKGYTHQNSMLDQLYIQILIPSLLLTSFFRSQF